MLNSTVRLPLAGAGLHNGSDLKIFLKGKSKPFAIERSSASRWSAPGLHNGSDSKLLWKAKSKPFAVEGLSASRWSVPGLLQRIRFQNFFEGKVKTVRG